MDAIDTNILARFYVDDPNDPEAAKQRPISYEIMARSKALFVPLTVILELEWVLRAFYRFEAEQTGRVFEHLLGLPNVTVEEWPRVSDAIKLHLKGLDFADALHLASSAPCEQLLTFDDRRFARRASRLNLKPKVVVPEPMT
jgi:predicted nucleic-acid-binding protein